MQRADFSWAWTDPEQSNAVIELAVEDEEVAQDGEGNREQEQVEEESYEEGPHVLPGCKRGRMQTPQKGTSSGVEEASAGGGDAPATERRRVVKETLPVNTAVVGTHSHVLKTVLTSPFKEKREKRCSLVFESEGELDLMKVLLRLMYGGDEEQVVGGLSKEQLFQLLLLSDKYEAQECMAVILERLLSAALAVLEADKILTALMDYPSSSTPALVRLSNTCKEVICNRFKDLDSVWIQKVNGDVDIDADFALLSTTSLELLLRSEATCVRSENTVFSLVVHYLLSHKELRTQADQQGAFDKLAPLIRFPQMGSPYLVDMVGKSKFLGEEGDQPGAHWWLLREALEWKLHSSPKKARLRERAKGCHCRYEKRAGPTLSNLLWSLQRESVVGLETGQHVCSPKWMVDGYLTYFIFKRITDEGVEKPAVKVLLLPVGDREVVSGGTKIMYYVNTLSRTNAQKEILHMTTAFVHNLDEPTTVQGRQHSFKDTWSDTIEMYFSPGPMQLQFRLWVDQD